MAKDNNKRPKRRDTVLAHAGRDPGANHGIVNPPVYHASTVVFPTVAKLEASQAAPFDHIHYGRYGTPTTMALEQAVAALEGGDKAISLPSGLSAIACTLQSFLKAGDHALIVDSTYFPTRRFCNGLLAGFGVEVTYYDPLIGAKIAGLIRPNTRLVFLESPGSLTFEVQDVPAIAKAARARGAVVVMDNTWSAGYYFQPFSHGVDVSIQAATKFIAGHSDAMLGVVTVRKELYEQVKTTTANLGVCAGVDECYLGLRGLRSLAARMPRHQETGLKLARWLKARPEVACVLHPALPECPGHELWKRDFTGASGLFSVVLKEFPKKAVAAMLDGLELFALGFSWGGFESLIVPIYPTKVRSVTRWPHPGPAVRIHAGLEDADDLIEDLAAGLKRLTAA
ncbi:MAG: cystathionine beta-lyase [Rhodospirillales bacterium RIFCSPLOWO2_12_FULL_67_15]|nr:MAG: cystathionine beta-lyase [Rhodospirillales bacterium RIFCSPLOWO2_12_FULL_67_15]